MPFVYAVVPTPATPLTTHATPNTENPNLALRQVTRGFDLSAIWPVGRAAAATSLNGIGFRVRRWTTAGSGGTSVTPSPRRIGTTAATTAHSSESALTPGTVSGAYQLSFGCGGAGPGGWTARDADAMIHVEGGGSDELNINSVAGTASLLLDISAEIIE